MLAAHLPVHKEKLLPVDVVQEARETSLLSHVPGRLKITRGGGKRGMRGRLNTPCAPSHSCNAKNADADDGWGLQRVFGYKLLQCKHEWMKSFMSDVAVNPSTPAPALRSGKRRPSSDYSNTPKLFISLKIRADAEVQ